MAVTPRRWLPIPVAGVLLILVSACAGGSPSPRHTRTGSPGPVALSPGSAPATGPASAPAGTCHPGVNGAESWIMGGSELGSLQAAAPAAVRRAVNTADLLVPGGARDSSRVGQTVADFKSYVGLEQAITRRMIPSTTHWVMYDNESWPQTPANEQRDPQRYETLFARLAHKHSLKVILAPAQDLVPGFSRTVFRSGHALWQHYVDLHFAAFSARVADIYEIQAQPYEFGPYRQSGTYLQFVRAAVAQAKAANPRVQVFAGLSTARVSTAAQLTQDFHAAAGLVSGFWLNIPHHFKANAPAMAGQFLDSLPTGIGAKARACAQA
ncbi:MAG TPA: hypothetical protein VGS19_17680 [Streptosporangiaceae bacterium]|nr:hypothetical protein [Streptosporangiaceae bacterium]